MKGIQQLKELVILLLKVHKALVEAKADGKITFWETLKFAAGLVPDLVTAAEGSGEVWEELKDLTDAEFGELFDLVAKEAPELLPNNTAGKDTLLLVVNWIKATISTFQLVRDLGHPTK